MSIADALQAEAGFVADATGLKSLVHAGNISTYVEVHMEQGPVLQVLQQPVGVVSGIVAQKRLQVHVPGEQGHAGAPRPHLQHAVSLDAGGSVIPTHVHVVPLSGAATGISPAAKWACVHPIQLGAAFFRKNQNASLHAGTVPMIGRKDAFVTAARIVTRLSERCTQHQQQKLAPRRSRLTHWLCNSAIWSAAGDGWGLRNRLCGTGTAPPPSHAVCTIGSAGVWPGAPNVIPGAVTLTVDLRAADQELERLEAMLHSVVANACRDAQCSTTTLHSARSVQSGLGTVAALQRAARSAAGGGDGFAPVMQSGAGHDAMAMADVAEVGMLFVRCRDGVSHSAEEFVAAGDMAAATRTLYAYLRETLF